MYCSKKYWLKWHKKVITIIVTLGLLVFPTANNNAFSQKAFPTENVSSNKKRKTEKSSIQYHKALALYYEPTEPCRQEYRYTLFIHDQFYKTILKLYNKTKTLPASVILPLKTISKDGIDSPYSLV